MPGWEIYLGTRVVVEFLSEKHPPRVPGPCTGEEVRAKHSKLPRRNAVNNTAQHRIGEKIPNFLDNTQNDMLKKRSMALTSPILRTCEHALLRTPNRNTKVKHRRGENRPCLVHRIDWIPQNGSLPPNLFIPFKLRVHHWLIRHLRKEREPEV